MPGILLKKVGTHLLNLQIIENKIYRKEKKHIFAARKSFFKKLQCGIEQG